MKTSSTYQTKAHNKKSRQGEVAMTPLSTKSPYDKLGLKAGTSLFSSLAKSEYESICGTLPSGCRLLASMEGAAFCHVFCTSTEQLKDSLAQAEKELFDDSILWVSWYKRSSAKGGEVSENLIRDLALEGTLVDVKVCSVSEEWSALKLVRRVRHRVSKQLQKAQDR